MNTNQTRLAYLQSQIDFLHGATLTRDLRGRSRVECYIIHKGGQKFFAKAYPQHRAQDLQNIEQTYLDLQIPTAKIITLQYLPETDETFCIYEYIDGKTFAELLPQLSLADSESLGHQIGQEIRKFHTLKGSSKNFQTQLDAELQNLVNTLRTQKSQYEQHSQKLLPVIDLTRFENSLNSLKTTIYSLPPSFTHTDINLTNIIIHDSKPVFIDTDGSKISFRALDFRGNVWWCWNPEMPAPEKSKLQSAYRGIYRGMFDDVIPKSFHQELNFTMLYEFLIRIQKYVNNPEQVHYSFLRWQANLQQTNYFENHHFPWF